MANAARPSRYAPTEAQERKLLSELPFVSRGIKAMCLNPSGYSIADIRMFLHSEHPKEMAKLDAAIMAPPKPAAPSSAAMHVSHARHLHAVPSAADVRAAEARAEQQDMIAQRMQSGAYAHDASRTTTYDPKTGIQRFGVGVAR